MMDVYTEVMVVSDRKCFSCGLEWSIGEKSKCKHYQKVSPGTMVKCPKGERRVDLQMCYVCFSYFDCEERERAEMDLMMHDEVEIKTRCKVHPRYEGKLKPRVDCKDCWEIFYKRRRQ